MSERIVTRRDLVDAVAEVCGSHLAELTITEWTDAEGRQAVTVRVRTRWYSFGLRDRALARQLRAMLDERGAVALHFDPVVSWRRGRA